MNLEIEKELEKKDNILEQHNKFMTDNGFPIQNIIYKYFPWKGSEYIKGNIENSKLYFSNPLNLNDPLDSYPVFQFSGVKDKGELEFSDVIQAAYPRASEEILQKYRGYKISLDEKTVEKIISEIRSSTGVCCFTAKNDNVLMWSHYADEHKGICLGFNRNINFKEPKVVITLLRSVIYCDERPKVDFLCSTPGDDKLLLTLWTKSKQWEYEEEYRCAAINYVGAISYNQECLQQIILGCNMSNDEKKEVVDIVKSLK